MQKQMVKQKQMSGFVLLCVTPQITLGDSGCNPDDRDRSCHPEVCIPSDFCGPDVDKQPCRPRDCLPYGPDDFCQPER